MGSEHYFSERPASDAERREVSVSLGGHTVTVETAGGVFSPDHVDIGTSVLLRHVPAPPPGELLDLGCGWGPIALSMAFAQPDARVWAVDVNERALDLTQRNAAALGLDQRIVAVTPDKAPLDIQFDALWSNPPIRIGKPALHTLLDTWIPRVRASREAWLVVQKNLGADSLTRWIREQQDAAGNPWGDVERVASSKGFRILRMSRTASATSR